MKTVISVFIYTQEFTEPFSGRIQVHSAVLLADFIFCLKKFVLSRKKYQESAQCYEDYASEYYQVSEYHTKGIYK